MMEEVVAKASIPVDVDADEKEQAKFRRFLDEVNPTKLIQHLESRHAESDGKSSIENKKKNLNNENC